MSFLAELKRRNVIRMAGLYVVGAWLVVQVAETLLPIFHTPDWVLQTLVVLLALGFVPALVFSWVFELTPEGLRRDGQVATDPAVSARTARRMDRLILLGMLALALLIFGARFWPNAPAADTAGADDAVPTAAADGQRDSIAVLPFTNMSQDPANEYFSDGISEEILNVLAGVPELKVAARTSSFSFKGKNMEIPEIARALNVRMVLEGSVRKQGDRVRITAQLIDAESGFHLWSQTYDRDLDDIFAIQDEIAQAIGSELKVTVGGSATGGRHGGTQDLAAYDLYLRGMANWHVRREAKLWEALALFQQAVAADPGFAQAYAGQALTYTVLPAYSGKIDWEEGLTRASDMGLRALALDPGQADAFAALSNTAANRLQRDTAKALIERAIALRPSYATGHHWHGSLLLNMGHVTEAVAALERAQALDPRSAVIADNLAFTLMASGRIEQAGQLCRAALAFAPDHPACLQYAAFAALVGGDEAAAAGFLEHMSEVQNPSAAGETARIIDALAGRADRKALATWLAALPFNSSVVPTSGNMLEDQMVLWLLMMLGEPGLALDYFERMALNLGNTMDWAVMLPAMDPIRCEPRFQAVVTQLRITDPRAAEACARP